MIYSILLSGGTGTRLGGDIPKQYIRVNNRPIIEYAIETLINHPMIEGIQIVADSIWEGYIQECIQTFGTEKRNIGYIGFSKPGVTRQLSIYNALADLKKCLQEDDLVLIHDAARPCLKEELVSRCINAMLTSDEIHGVRIIHDGVLPVLPMKDTVYICENGVQISGLLDRTKVYAGQAPELFVFGKYLKANEALIDKNPPETEGNAILAINGSTEPAILAGLDVVTIAGDEGNIKITTQDDLERYIKQF